MSLSKECGINLKSIKHINQKDVWTVTGYLRSIELLLPDSSAYYNIPEPVNHLILSYYHRPEYFTICGSRLQIDDIQDTLTHKTDEIHDFDYNDVGTAYGNIMINGDEDHVLVWIFKIIKCKDGLYIGIDSSNRKHPDSEPIDPWTKKYTFWSYAGGANAFLFYNIQDEMKNGCVNNGFYAEDWRDNDILRMEVDVPNQTIKYILNDKDTGIAFNDINLKGKQFCLAISSEEGGQSVQLLDFQRI